MPENLKIGLSIAEQRKKCAEVGCHEEFFALGFGQSPFHDIIFLKHLQPQSNIPAFPIH
jgi:hypothetical protein